ncbi:MAG: hypothetical protein IPG45_22890 [Deltaproteobacteria bacterium]|nr:hypothetical protein [Deltaproteobacteria bacterium]
MARRTFAFVALLVVSACAPRGIRVLAEMPPEVEWLGLLFLDANGRVTASTGLMRKTAGEGVDHLHQMSLGDAERMVLVGVKEDDLRTSLTFPGDEQLLLDGRLALAAPNDPLLPIVWAAAGPAQEDPAFLRAEIAPEVTAPWLPACPRLLSDQPDPRVRFGTNTGLFCPASATQMGCRLDADLRGCLTKPPPELILNGRGALQQRGLGSECRNVTPREGAQLSFRCYSGAEEQADLYLPPMPEPFIVDRTTLVAVADPTQRLAPISRPLSGHLRAVVAPRGCPTDPVIVLRQEDPFEHCGPTGGVLIFVDSVDLSITATVTLTVPCMNQLAPDPSGPGFFGVSGRPVTVTHFDCRGRPDATYRPAEVLANDLEVRAVTLAARASNREETDLIVGTRRVAEDPGWFWVFDTVERRFADPVAVEMGGEIMSMASLGPDSLVLGVRALGDDTGVRLHFTQYAADSPRWVQLANGATIAEKTPHFLVAHQGYVIAGSASGTTQGIPTLRTAQRTASGPEYLDSSADWMGYGSTSTGIPWPNSPYVLLPTTAEALPREEEPLPRTVAGLFDPRDQHFLPGRADLGYGPVSAAAADRSGAVWMTLTWTGELFRIRARPTP